MTINKDFLKQIGEAFAKGDIEFAAVHFAADITWNILGEGVITGKEQVIEVLKMSQLESVPVIAIKNILADGNFVVIESTGQAITKKGKPYNQAYCDVFYFKNEKLQEITTYLDTEPSRKSLL